MTADHATAVEALRDAIEGERLDWHMVPVHPGDIRAVLDRLARAEAALRTWLANTVRDGECDHGFWWSDCTNDDCWWRDVHLAAHDTEAGSDE